MGAREDLTKAAQGRKGRFIVQRCVRDHTWCSHVVAMAVLVLLENHSRRDPHPPLGPAMVDSLRL